MEKGTARKVQTDVDAKRKAIKLVLAHLRKKVEKEYTGADNIRCWIDDMEKIIEKPEFVIKDYIQMRRDLNDLIERTMDEEMRFKLRDSWYSLGRALDKKIVQ